jgi:hypothetical protein
LVIDDKDFVGDEEDQISAAGIARSFHGDILELKDQVVAKAPVQSEKTVVGA